MSRPPPRFVPTLTEVVASPAPAPKSPAGPSALDLQRLQGRMMASLETTAGFAAERFGLTLTGDPALLVEITKLREAVEKLQRSSEQTAANTKLTAETLDNTTGGGGPMLVEIAP